MGCICGYCRENDTLYFHEGFNLSQVIKIIQDELDKISISNMSVEELGNYLGKITDDIKINYKRR